MKTEADDPATEVDAAIVDVKRLGDEVRALSAAVADVAERLARLERRVSAESDHAA